MRIGLVCPYGIDKGGGVQEHVFALYAELTRRGHRVSVITPQSRDHIATTRKDIIFVGKGADFNSPLHTTIQVSAGFNGTIDHILEHHHFDILHLHEPWVPMLSAQILSRSTCANVATFHAKLPETMMARTMIKVVTPYTRSVLKYIHEFTAVSVAAAEYVSTLSDRSVTIIPNGIDAAKFAPARQRSDTTKHKTILYVGRLEQRKGVKHLLFAFQLLSARHPEVSLVIAGDGPDRQKLESRVDELELANVSFLGQVSDQDKIKLLHSADLFCSPALYGESFGIVLLEAMASGLVTVAGDNPGYASVMEGVGGISLAPPKHHAEFARRLELLLCEPELRKVWRTWAQSQMPRYDYRTIADQYEVLYKQALKRLKTGQPV
jgi:phosphatidylinositol alpha-mannosyltransferase